MPYQHTRVPEVQTTGDTTPVKQIVYAVSLRHRVEVMHKAERSFAKTDVAAASPQSRPPDRSRRFPLSISRFARPTILERLFYGTVFIDAVDAVREGDASRLCRRNRAGCAPTGNRRQDEQ